MRPLNISASQAKDYYYGKDVVFDADKSDQNDKNETFETSQWHGKLADEFGLKGPCKTNDFLNIISGNDPKGNQIVAVGVNQKHRAAIDIPLAAPKSVSVLALHVGDKNLIDAHQKAIIKTVKYIEENYLYSRRTENGITTAKKTKNGLFATFIHSTSRANEPHLHTHTLTMNMTKADAGYRATFNDLIFKDQTLINYIYQSELAKNVKELGYNIANNSKGKWEIAGFKEEWIDKFSTRSKEIDNALDDKDKDDAKKRDNAQRNSRAQKNKSIKIDELKKKWEGTVSKNEIKEAVEIAKEKEDILEKQLSPRDYIRLSYETIHENESTFKRQDVLKIALEFSRGELTVNDFETAFFDAIKDNEIELLKTYRNKKGVETPIFTSDKMHQNEKEVVNLFDKSKNVIDPVVSPKFVKDVIKKDYSYFTDGQKKAVESILTSKNRFTIIQGDAGTGKTSALKAVKDILDQSNSNVEIKGFGYTGKASREIINKAGIESRTLHSFLNQSKPSELDSKSDSEPELIPSPKKEIWIVDESSMVGSIQMKEIMDKSIEQDSRIVFIGDGKQLPAICAGRMFKDLQKKNHIAVKMEEVLRQKTEHMKKAVRHIKEYQTGNSTTGIDDAFNVLGHRIKEVGSEKERISIAANYCINNPDCVVITPLNKDRLSINEKTHEQLKEDKDELNVSIHTPIYLNGTARYFARNYEVGQKAFIQNSSIEGLEAGQEVTISGIDALENQLLFSSNDQKYNIDLKKNDVSFSVYDVEERSFFEGEKIVFLKNDRSLDISNGQTATIKSIGPKQIITAKIDGQNKDVRINLDFYPYIDRGYAITGHKSQGQTAKEVLFVTKSALELSKKGFQLNNSEMLYVAITRAENDFTLLTDNVNELKEEFKEGQNKTSTLYFTKEHQRSLER